MAVDTGHTQGSGTKTLAAQNQDDGTEALDQAQPHQRRVHVGEKAERKEVQGCTPRKDLKRIAAVGSVETAQARTDHRRASFCALTDTAMWVDDYQSGNS